MPSSVPLLIDGKLAASRSRRKIPVLCPATQKTLALAPCAAPAEIDRAIAGRQARFRRMARHPGARPRARDVRIPAAAEAKSRPPRPRRRRRQRQNLRRRARRCLARHRSRRASMRRPRRDARRFASQPRARRRHRLLRCPARRRRRRHAVQFPGDDPALDVPARRRLRQHFRLKAVRAGAAGGDGIGQIVHPSGRSGGRFANRPWRRRGGRSNPRPSGYSRRVFRRISRGRAAHIQNRRREF